MPYEYISQFGKLSDIHREELKTKRGFTEDTIKRNRFFSGGKYLLEIEKDLVSRFEEAKLLSTGVCIHDGKVIHLSPILLEERVAIPYLNKDGKAYYLRLHKSGLKGIPIEIYQELNISAPGDKGIIITEGEFKAAAACQLGFNGISIPGIASFSKEHYPRLVKFLNSNTVKEVVVLFDNEIKDDPHYPDRYKENPSKRYDSQFYAYIMADMLAREGFKAHIAWLPDGWRVEGKIDIDGALAQRKTKNDILCLIQASKTARQFMDDLPAEAQKILRRKNAQRYFRSHIRKEFGHYVVTRYRGKQETDETISNFTVQIIATHETFEGRVREVQFINEFGEVTACFSLMPNEMASTDEFSTFCLSKGNYIWRGNGEDLKNIWEGEFLNDDGRHIVEPDHVGWLEESKIWLFGNVAITADGKELRADKNGIFWTEKKGFKPIPIGVTTGRDIISTGVPYLYTGEFDVQEYLRKLSDTITAPQAKICIGWAAAVLFIEDLFPISPAFPFLYFKGKKGSGKTHVATWVKYLFGIEGEGIQIDGTTAVAAQRYLSYYSSLPVLMDDYRNGSDKVTNKNGLFRNVYNRQAAGKGIKSDFGIREARIRGTLMFTGEETPRDPALLERCIPISVSERLRKSDQLRWMGENKNTFSAFTLDILRKKKDLLPTFMRVFEEARLFFVSQGRNARTAVNYAVISAGYAVVFDEKDIEFAKFITTETDRVYKENEGESAIARFFEDIAIMAHRGEIKPVDWWEGRNGILYVYFNGLYALWQESCRRRGEDAPFKKSAIHDYLRDEPGWIALADNREYINCRRQRVIAFCLDKSPEYIQELWDGETVPKDNANENLSHTNI